MYICFKFLCQNYEYTKILLPIWYKDVNEAQYSIWRPTQKICQLHSKYQSKCSMVSLKWLAPYFRRFDSFPKLSNCIIFGTSIRTEKFNSLNKISRSFVSINVHATYFFDVFKCNYCRNRDNCSWNYKPEYQNPYHVSNTSLIGMPVWSTSWIFNQNRMECEIFKDAEFM